VQLALAPLINHPSGCLINPATIIVDAKSGISGAGRKAELSLNAAENMDNFKAYGIAGHRHQPEICQGLAELSNRQLDFGALVFIPHLVPMVRGMLSTIYVDLLSATDIGALQDIYSNYYQHEPFVDVLPTHINAETRNVRGSNLLNISVNCVSPLKAVIIATQDNLVKGAAGQAVQNMNIMFGIDETAGLGNIIPLYP
jgi:N-acetyl-gamma-glutamyl-phosphate reductase